MLRATGTFPDPAFMEAFAMGFNACRAGVPHDDGEAFLAAMREAWDRTGGERARRLVAELEVLAGPPRDMLGGGDA